MIMRDKSKFFDSIADTWDANEVKSTPEKIEQLLEIISVKKNEKVLDLGTGTGVLIPYLSRRVGDKGEVIGLDFSWGMLSHAISKYGNLNNVGFVQSDFEKNKIVGKYSLIMMYCVYPHIEEPTRLLTRLIKENLEENGRIVVAFPCDETFINNVHGDKKAEADLLPSAPILSHRLDQAGFNTKVLDYSSDIYIVEIRYAKVSREEGFIKDHCISVASQEFPFSGHRSRS